jgi:hypothetical protein
MTKDNPTLTDFQSLCKAIWAQRIKVDEMASALKIETCLLEMLKAKVLAYMEASEIEKQHVPGFGTLSVQSMFSVRVPTGDRKAEFFEYLKECGTFEDLATVHSATLNSWYQQELEQAIAEGRDDFRAPGIEEPKIVKRLNMRRGK